MNGAHYGARPFPAVLASKLSLHPSNRNFLTWIAPAEAIVLSLGDKKGKVYFWDGNDRTAFKYFTYKCKCTIYIKNLCLNSDQSTFFKLNSVLSRVYNRKGFHSVPSKNRLTNHNSVRSDDVQCVRLGYQHAAAMCWLQLTCELRNKSFTSS